MANLTSTIKIKLDSSSVKKGAESMKARFKKLGGAMKASMALAAVGMVAYFKKFASEMDRIGKLSKRLDIGVESLQRLGIAAELAGTDTETLVKGLQTLNKNLATVKEGSKSYDDSLRRLKLSAEDLIDLDMESQLIELTKAYHESEQGPRDLAAVLELLGKSGGELVPRLKEGPDALADAMGRANVSTKETIAEMEKLNDMMTVAGKEIQTGFGETFMWIVKAARTVGSAIAEMFLKTKIMIEETRKLMAGEDTNFKGRMDDQTERSQKQFDEIWGRDLNGMVPEVPFRPDELNPPSTPERTTREKQQRLEELDRQIMGGSDNWEDQAARMDESRKIKESMSKADAEGWIPLEKQMTRVGDLLEDRGENWFLGGK